MRSPAKLVGQCRDAAGHLSAPTNVELRYDGTPPARPKVKWAHRGESVFLAWVASKDVVRTRIVRAPGVKATEVCRRLLGKGRSYVDRRLRSGARYWYEVAVFDQAGNRCCADRRAPAGCRDLRAAGGCRRRRPPLVSWSPVKSAEFYNLQFWRGKAKLLTTWVRAPKLALRHAGRSKASRDARRRALQGVRVGGARHACEAALRQASGPGRLRRQTSLTPERLCAPAGMAAVAACGRIDTMRRNGHLARWPPAFYRRRGWAQRGLAGGARARLPGVPRTAAPRRRIHGLRGGVDGAGTRSGRAACARRRDRR